MDVTCIIGLSGYAIEMGPLMRETQKDENNLGGKPEHPVTEAPLLADHPALDLLNTVVRAEGGIVDTWQSDQDVLRWLVRTGLLESKAAPALRRGALLDAARTLRETLRPLLVARKTGKRIDPAALNRFLAKGRSHQELIRAGAVLTVTRRHDRLSKPAIPHPLSVPRT